MGREIGSVRPVWKPKNGPAERWQRMLTRKCPVPEDWASGKAGLDGRWLFGKWHKGDGGENVGRDPVGPATQH